MIQNFSYFKFNDPNTIKYVLITDKSTRLLGVNKYNFIVNPRCTKNDIKIAVERLFNVKVNKINTCHLPKKKKLITRYLGYKPKYKKAIVTLLKGNRISLFE
mmetsp:Transcript_27990/g.43085  ORF Transcript_27990/g.43085 Transcript_27990/m.43085 type:complete len:102 (-) Transcript_27990:8715-9020(-)